MRWTSAVAAIAFVASAVFPGMAFSACDGRDRISAAEASCLGARWRNPTGVQVLTKKAGYVVRNFCPEDGTVVAKVDVRSAMDRTLHLTDGRQRKGNVHGKIRGIYCCSDLSDICSR